MAMAGCSFIPVDARRLKILLTKYLKRRSVQVLKLKKKKQFTKWYITI